MQVKLRYAYLCVAGLLLVVLGYAGYRQSDVYHAHVIRGVGSGYVPYDPGPVRYLIAGASSRPFIDDQQMFSEIHPPSLSHHPELPYRGAAILDPAPDDAYLKKQELDGFGFVEKDGEELHGYNLNCRMETCFDFSRCKHKEFYVYVYPIADNEVGPIYAEILAALFTSRHYTSNPDKACLFIASVDTLDRDERSTERFIRDANARLRQLPYWNGGRNHLIFNLYSGTWPDYREHELAFDVGYAAFAKASISQAYYRRGFDISFPLFHAELASRGGEGGSLQARKVPAAERSHALVFKGKRYLTGIGSETRNALYHIYNGDDVLLLTTCRHGSGWQKMQDERCEKDNQDYDKYDYKVLLHNSTFCLVPRGRRLGSYRFLESLQAACIPVLLSNGWVLPFSEIIDWNKAVVWGDERLLLQVPSIVRSMSNSEVLSLRQQTQFLWQTYFSSIDKIVQTTLQIVKERIHSHLARTGYVWNNVPGALAVQTDYTHVLSQLPFYYKQIGASVTQSYTALIYATENNVISGGSLYKLLATISKSRYIQTIVVLWHCDVPHPLDRRWPVPNHVSVKIKHIHSIDDRYNNHREITTDAVISLDADSQLTTDELDFAFSTWRQFPDRIVGFSARGHYWDESTSKWTYSSKLANHFSIILTDAAVIHRYYLHMYNHTQSHSVRQLLQRWPHCATLYMNFIVSDITKLPHVKVTPRRRTNPDAERTPTGNPANVAAVAGVAQAQQKDLPLSQSNALLFEQRSACLNAFASEFGYMPLKRSNVRLDPHLYGDQVSIARKKYRQIEHVT